MSRGLAVTAALLLFAGCASSPAPEFYVLAPVPGITAPTRSGTVLLRDVGVAKYLDRPQVVRSTDGNRLVLADNARWGEPLAQMLARVVAENLSQRLPLALVLRETSAVGGTHDVVVELDIQRMDADGSGAVVLVAQLGRQGEVVETVRLVVPPTGPTTLDEVRAMSIAVGQLSDRVADILR